MTDYYTAPERDLIDHRVKLVLPADLLRQALGLPDDVRVLTVDHTNDPVTVSVVVCSRRFPAVEYHDVETPIARYTIGDDATLHADPR